MVLNWKREVSSIIEHVNSISCLVVLSRRGDGSYLRGEGLTGKIVFRRKFQVMIWLARCKVCLSYSTAQEKPNRERERTQNEYEKANGTGTKRIQNRHRNDIKWIWNGSASQKRKKASSCWQYCVPLLSSSQVFSAFFKQFFSYTLMINFT